MIPQIIHQIWIQGHKNIPIELKKYHDDCQKINNNFKFILWDNEKIQNFLIRNYDKKYVDLYNNFKIFAQKADFARYAILYKYGGIYIDMDMICRKNLSSFLKYNFFLTVDDPILNSFNKKYLNGIIGTIPNHIIFEFIFKNIFLRKDKLNDVAYSTGTNLFYDSVQEYKKVHKNDVTIIDSEYLHPCSIFQDEKTCPYKCQNCYIAHTNYSSWSPKLKLFKYVKNNLLLICLSFIFLIIFIWLIRKKLKY